MRPKDDDILPMVEALRWHHEHVAAAGSPTAALIIAAVADDLADAGSLADVLPATTRFGDLPALRVMATVHRLALARRAPAVALFLPTLGGTPPVSEPERAAFRRDVVDVLATHADELRAGLARTPQTNETGRAALLRSALCREGTGRPVLLREIGASAGLNLRADHLPGDPRVERGPLPVIVDRLGCDLNPVDPASVDGRTLLSSYVWVDDVERFARLGRALEVAARVPAPVLRMDAAEFCDALELRPGHTTVLWHSAMWLYLPSETRARIRTSLSRMGASATPDAPLVHASWEWDTRDGAPPSFALVVRRWDGSDRGGPRLVARGMSHGQSLSLVDGAPLLDVDPLATA